MSQEQLQWMHDVLDGEASDENARQLDRLLAVDPVARAEYEELQRLFAGLKANSTASLPDEVLADVLSKVRIHHKRPHRFRQLSVHWRVLVSDAMRLKGTVPHWVAGTQTGFQREHNIRNAVMSGQTSKRNLWIGIGAAAVVAVVASRYFDLPASHDMAGTIAPAQRSVAEQPGAGDVTGTDSGLTSASTIDTLVSADAARDAAHMDAAKFDAAKSDAMRADAAKFDAAKADAMRTDAAKFDAAKADAMKSDAAKADAGRADAAKFDAAKADAMKADAAKFDAAKADAMRADAAKFDAARADAARSDAARMDGARSDAARSDAARMNAARSDAAKSDAAKLDAARADAAKADSARSDASRSN